MDERQTSSRLRVAEIREESAVRTEQREMVREERTMEGEMRRFIEDEHAAEREIEQEWRAEHWGHEPERPPAWKAPAGRPGSVER